MRKIDEFVKSEQAFPDAEQKKSEELKGEVLLLKGCALREGDDGDFFIILAEHNGTEISFSNGGVAIVKAIKNICKSDNLDYESRETVMFAEPVECVLAETKSKGGRSYYIFESTAIQEEKK